MAKLDSYRTGIERLPDHYEAWELFGAGMESVGREGMPTRLDLRAPRDNEVLLRVDALGICLSDIKIIKQGSAHPRLRGRDLASEPTVLGHECSVTVVAVGANYVGRFAPGERYIVQADIYYHGEGFAFGYLIRGGMAEYTYLDERALDGDEGCYLLPVDPQTGYSQAALAEPWACVEMSYCLDERRRPGNGRTLEVRDEADLAALPAGAKFDDIVLHAPTPQLVERLAAHLDKDAVMYLVGVPAEDGEVTVDVGAVHYQGHRYLGGGATLEDIAAVHARNDILPGGVSLYMGAGGPMGQMHVQRALEKADGSKRVVATDLDHGRLQHLQERFGSLSPERGAELITVCIADFADSAALEAHLRSLAPEGYDDVSILAPVPQLVPQAMRLTKDDGFINLFAGVPVGTTASLSLRDLCRGITIIGSSGSRISDLRRVLELIESGALDTNRSVAAIGGFEAARDGLAAVRDAKFPGKTVIYPQVHGLPLMALNELPQQVPALAEYLSRDGAWTQEAEAALLEMMLP